MLRLFLFAMLAVAAPVTASAQPREAAAGIWERRDGRSTFVAAGIGLPNSAGTVTLAQLAEFSSHGNGMDNVAQFSSPDREVFATVYIYSPNLPHAGLTAFMTDDVVRASGGSDLEAGQPRLVSAGGQQAAAIRTDYRHYRGNLASSAAFLKVGQWIVKIRVSGPEARRDEVERAITALLAGISFQPDKAARAPELLAITGCPQAASTRAAPLPSDTTDDLAEALSGAVEGDEHTREADGPSLLAPRFGTAWCLSSRARIGNSSFPILRSLMPSTPPRQRSVLVLLLTDAGTLLEVVETHREGRYVLFHHQIGRTQLLAAFDGVPTDSQISDILSGADRVNGRVRATISQNASGDRDVGITAPPPAAPST